MLDVVERPAVDVVTVVLDGTQVPLVVVLVEVITPACSQPIQPRTRLPIGAEADAIVRSDAVVRFVVRVAPVAVAPENVNIRPTRAVIDTENVAVTVIVDPLVAVLL